MRVIGKITETYHRTPPQNRERGFSLGAAMALLAQDDNSQKITHDYCQYRNGTPQENCGNCHHYTGNGCEIVQDPIQPNMVCNFHCPAQNQQSGLLPEGY